MAISFGKAGEEECILHPRLYEAKSRAADGITLVLRAVINRVDALLWLGVKEEIFAGVNLGEIGIPCVFSLSLSLIFFFSYF